MAQNKIVFKWRVEEEMQIGEEYPHFYIKISFSEPLSLFPVDNIFAVDWGDGKTDTYRVEDLEFYSWFNRAKIDHYYDTSDGEEYQVTILTAEHCSTIALLSGSPHYGASVIELDLSNAPDLTELDYNYWSVSELDVRQNTKLKHLSWYGGEITKLDLSQNNDLESLHPHEAMRLDLSKNKKLKELSCYSNVDLSQNLALETLYFYGNPINVSKLVNLKTLYCNKNELTKLDLSKNIALEVLSCEYNNLTELDLTNNPNLEFLDCGDNQLTKLDVSNNIALKYLYCSNNPLTSLKLNPKTLENWDKENVDRLIEMGFGMIDNIVKKEIR